MCDLFKKLAYKPSSASKISKNKWNLLKVVYLCKTDAFIPCDVDSKFADMVRCNLIAIGLQFKSTSLAT